MKKNKSYDAMGQRIAKTVTNKNTTDGTDKFVTTYYVRNPQGNVLAVYEKKEDAAGAGQFQLKERHLYGAGRLGMVSQNVTLAQFDNSNVTNGTDPTTPQAGDTHYELTNHLGNVMAVISDTTSATAEPTVVSLSDYYPFGMTEPGRSWNSGDYRFGYTGHEKENDLAEGVYTTEYRLLDTRLGRWMSVDPLFGKYPGMSSYNYCGGNVLNLVDDDGSEPEKNKAGTVSDFMYVLNNESSRKVGKFKGAQAAEYMKSLNGTEFKWSQMRPFPNQTTFFNKFKGKYIYTTKAGWLDMVHFMFYAGAAYNAKLNKQEAIEIMNSKSYALFSSSEYQAYIFKLSRTDPVAEALQDGYFQEMTDKYAARHSAYSYEDLPSDKYGAEFGANYFDPNSNLSLAEQLENYLNSLGATSPENAPNYNTLPDDEGNLKTPSKTNKTTKPVYTKPNGGVNRCKPGPKSRTCCPPLRSDP